MQNKTLSGLAAAALSLSVALLTGCGMAAVSGGKSSQPPVSAVRGAITGRAIGGQNPIHGGSVYLYAANTTTSGAAGYGSASVSLLKQGGVDYVPTTDSGGFFDITNLYTCPATPNTPVYLLITGGDPGLGTGTNSNLALMAAIGSCDTLLANAATTFVNVNEVTTVAAAYALSGFMASKTNLGASSTNFIGLTNAFNTAAQLANTATGMAYATTSAGNGTVPQNEINALADMLSVCINSSGGSAAENGGSPTTNCGKLFAAASNGTAPTDTVQAILNIARNPGSNVGAILNLIPGIGMPFATTFSTANDLTIAINYTGGGIHTPQSVALDASGNAWIASAANAVTELSAGTASFTSGANGFTSGNLDAPASITVDTSGSVWIANCGDECSDSGNPSSITKYVPSGNTIPVTVTFTNITDPSLLGSYAIAADGNNIWTTNAIGNDLTMIEADNSAVLSGSGFIGNGSGLDNPVSVAIDSAHNAWTVSPTDNALVELDTTGAVQSGSYSGSGLNYPYAVAIDHSGFAWIANHGANSVSVINSGIPITGSPFTGGGLNLPLAIALDGAGSAWVVNANNSITALKSDGSALSPVGYTTSNFAYPNGIAIDASGNVWITNCGTYCTGTGSNPGSVIQFVGVATPVTMPLAAAVAGNTLATRP